MRYQLKVDGVSELNERLTMLENQAPAVAAQALYDGAGIMADAINQEAQAIRTEPFKWASRRHGATRLPSPEEKEIVLNASAGIARFDKDLGEVNTSIGYQQSGYADLNGKTVPVPVIANSINSGTSFMNKQPFIRKGASKGKPKAMAAMRAKIEERFAELTKK